MQRYLAAKIKQDLPHKIVLLSGPRQTGKTTLAKQLYSSFDYFNYDVAQDRVALQRKQWDRDKSLVIFDELHKQKDWKRWIKGIYDTESIPPQLMVTGSAKMDTFRQVGDSLAGRYFQYRLHPFDLKEIAQYSTMNPEQAFETLWHCSGFPEPFLKGSPNYYKRWRQSHLNIILKQDLIDLYTISNLKALETLVLLLQERIGSNVSYANLARDLGKDAGTIKRYLEHLESLYIIFRVAPYHSNITRSLLKEPKYYFYDWTYARDDGARLENFVACALLKELDYIEDTTGTISRLHFVRTKDGREIDFLTSFDQKPKQLIEVKYSNSTPSANFCHFAPQLPVI